MNKIVDEFVVSGSFIDNCYVVAIQGELDDETLDKICTDIVRVVYDTEVRGTILDFNSISVFDTHIFEAFKKITKMVTIMGVKVIWLGLKPGIVSALVDFNEEVDDITIAVNIQHGLEIIKSNTIKPDCRGKLYYK